MPDRRLRGRRRGVPSRRRGTCEFPRRDTPKESTKRPFETRASRSGLTETRESTAALDNRLFRIRDGGARVSAPPDPSPSSHLPRPPHRPSPRRSRRASPSALPARSATVRPHATRRRVPSVRYRRVSFSPRLSSQRAKAFSLKTRKTAQSRTRARDFSSDALSSHRSLLFLHPNKKTRTMRA